MVFERPNISKVLRRCARGDDYVRYYGSSCADGICNSRWNRLCYPGDLILGVSIEGIWVICQLVYGNYHPLGVSGYNLSFEHMGEVKLEFLFQAK
jgi:hypothetical protein